MNGMPDIKTAINNHASITIKRKPHIRNIITRYNELIRGDVDLSAGDVRFIFEKELQRINYTGKIISLIRATAPQLGIIGTGGWPCGDLFPRIWWRS